MTAHLNVARVRRLTGRLDEEKFINDLVHRAIGGWLEGWDAMQLQLSADERRAAHDSQWYDEGSFDPTLVWEYVEARTSAVMDLETAWCLTELLGFDEVSKHGGPHRWLMHQLQERVMERLSRGYTETDDNA